MATLLTLSFDTHGLLLGSEKWSLMQQHKDYIKRQLGKGGKCTLHLLRLPENPEELPEELRLRAFPGQEATFFKAADPRTGLGLRIVPGTDGFWDRNGFYSDLFVYRLGIIPQWRSAAFAAGNKCGAS